ncbi:MAG: PcfB family protein [Clostridiales bacterium]|nr:PcfB family protein [Clostridiales bacterium]
MQEEIENRTINLAISTTKLTGRALMSAFRKFMQHRSNVKAKKAALANEKPVGEQTIDQLIGQNQGATNIEIEKTDVKGFKKILDKYGVDYAITKDPSQEPPRYLVFFKARDGDALTAAFKEYNATLVQKKKTPSVLKQLSKFKELVAGIPKKVREKSQERDL